MFVGREAELNFLENNYSSEDSRIIVVYGQRGVGKTTLLEHFSHNKKSSYFAARSCSPAEQRYQWGCEQREAGRDVSRFPEYAELFHNAVWEEEYGKQIIIIDEFHHSVKNDSGFMEEIIRFMHSRPASKPVMFILCTSASGWVENSMIKRMGSTALSIGGLLKVREMKFAEICKLFPGYSGEDYIDIYSILGGIPGLWNSFCTDYSARDNIIKNFLSKGSRLYGEMSVIMSEDLREPAVYSTILACMARGLHKLNDIYKHTGFSRAKISVYLKNLMELELVEKVYSFETSQETDTQKGIYRISNSYVRFYFRFIFPNLSLLQKVTAEEFYDSVVADAFPAFAEEAYRRICRETVSEYTVSVGEWLGKSGSLDIVAADRNGDLTVAACSYASRMNPEDYEWLLFCMNKAGIKDAVKLLFCEKGFSDELREEAMKGNVELRRIL